LLLPNGISALRFIVISLRFARLSDFVPDFVSARLALPAPALDLPNQSPALDWPNQSNLRMAPAAAMMAVNFLTFSDLNV
jgi:hypothetical protein